MSPWDDIDPSIAEIRVWAQAEPPGSRSVTGMSCGVPFTLNRKQARPRWETPDLLLTSALERDKSASAGPS